MMSEIKKRIEQIRRGEVPEGYKRTNAGIAPSEWNEFLLGEIFTERKSSGNPELPILSVSIHSGVSDGELDEDALGKKVKRIEDKTQYKTAFSGDLVFNMMRAWQGAIGVASSDGLVSPAYIVAAPTKKVVPQFMDYYMKTLRMISAIDRKSYGVTDFRKRLYWNSLALISCTLPSIAEQQKIAAILTTQDKVIELQQCKIEELKKFKKGCLDKIFPKNGQTVPEVRFPGFTGAWEQRKLGDVAKFGKGHGYSKNDLRETGTPIILYGRMYTHYETLISDVDTFASARSGSLYSTGKEVIVPASGETAEDIATASSVGKSGVLLGGDLNVLYPDESIEPVFLALSISNGRPKKEMAKRAQGKSVVHLHNTDLQDVDLAYPKNDEQRQINAFFLRLDHLITLHQRKLKEMQNYKKALMQLLLTGIVRVS